MINLTYLQAKRKQQEEAKIGNYYNIFSSKNNKYYLLPVSYLSYERHPNKNYTKAADSSLTLWMRKDT
jgi:hypothetical protein